jgi:hypothetical protein
MNDFIIFLVMLTPSLPHMHLFFFNDTCYLGSTKFLESIVVFDSFLEGRSSTGSRMLW